MRTYAIAQGPQLILFGDLTGKEIQKREDIYIHTHTYMWLSVQQKLTQNCKATPIKFLKK